MTKKRDIIEEVLSRRTRHLKRIPRLGQAMRRLSNLYSAVSYLQRQKTFPLRLRRELYRHAPVALIAISEGYCRMLYRDLIDKGEPFLSNAKSFKDIRLDLGILIATHDHTITPGEIIAQQLPHNNLGDIESNLSIILGQDFTAEFNKRLQEEDAALGGRVFQTHLRRLVVDLFRQRHVYCHEMATAVSPRQYEIATMIKAFRIFLYLIEEHATSVKASKSQHNLEQTSSPNTTQ